MSRRRSCYYINQLTIAQVVKVKKIHSADGNKRSSMKNNFCLETLVKNKITDILLINRTRSPRKKDLSGQPHPLGNCLLLDPPLPSEFSLPSAGGMDIFWNYTLNNISHSGKCSEEIWKGQTQCVG